MAKKKIIDNVSEERIIERPLDMAVHDYMMPYAEYIILERALPRVEDGLKPVQRRILYTMSELKMWPDGPFKKSARVVGDCLGKYHPHGDISIYLAMVNMAQDFNMRCPLVKGHGNFGSIDNDPPAAMRYTEVKLEALACELLTDLDKGTVKWVKNFDDTLEEPDILPGKFPNLLVNGAMGIAIGLATKIPPHNLTECINGAIALIDNPKITTDELLHYIKGPDFPTGAFVIPGDSFHDIYETGRGKIIMRAKVDIETGDNDRQNIVITELPYGVIKSDLLAKIRDLRDNLALKKDKNGEKLENPLSGIQEITDESDRHGIRSIIRLRKGEDAVKILEYLYQKTELQSNFNVNLVAIAEGKPQQLGLVKVLSYYVNYQREVVLKRSQFDLKAAKTREHILDGFAIILPCIDEVVALIKSSQSRSEAKSKLRESFGLSEAQADAILDLRLVALTRMEVKKIETELSDLKKLIAKLEKIIASKKVQFDVVKEELTAIRDKYPSKRLSVIVENLEDIEHKAFDITKSIGKRGYVVIDYTGKLKFVSPRQYLSADRLSPKTAGAVCRRLTFVDKGMDTLVFGSYGNAYKINFDDVMEKRWDEEGDLLNKLAPEAPEGETCIAAITLTEEMLEQEIYLFTKLGMVKKSLVKDYVVNKNSYQVCVIKEGDEIINVELKKEYANVVFVSSDGMCVNSTVEDYPLQGRKAGGVIGMQLNEGAYCQFAGQIETEDDELVGELVLVANGGFAKRVLCGEIEAMKRARKGVKVMDVKGDLIFAGGVTNPYDIALIDGENKVYVINTDEIFIDRNRLGKGKALPQCVGCVTASVYQHNV